MNGNECSLCPASCISPAVCSPPQDCCRAYLPCPLSFLWTRPLCPLCLLYYFCTNTAVFRSSLRWNPEWLLIVPFDPEPDSEWLKSWTGGLRVPPCTLKSIHLFLLLAAGHQLLKSQTTPPIYSSSITSLASPRFSRQPPLYMPTVPALPVFPPFPCQSAW